MNVATTTPEVNLIFAALPSAIKNMMKIVPVNKIKNLPEFDLICNPTDQVIAPTIEQQGFWEPVETSVVLQILERDYVVFDIGANLGYYTILVSKIIGGNGQVHAFEPSSINYKLLQANAIINDCQNTVIHKKALSDYEGTSHLYLSESNFGDHQLFESQERSMMEEVEVTTIDTTFSQHHCDFVKIDTQGSEFSILKGMRNFIRHNQNHLMMLLEFSPHLLEQAGVQCNEFIDELRDLQAKVFCVDTEATTIYTIDGVLCRESVGLRFQDWDMLEQLFYSFSASEDDVFTNFIIFFSEAAIAKYSTKFIFVEA